MSKTLVKIIILWLLTIILPYLLTNIAKKRARSPSSLLRLTMCDVGQGDALLLQYRSEQVLIDAGRDEKVLSCLWSQLPTFDRTLELVVATHPDADHIGGFPLVFNQFSVRSLLLPPVTRKTADFVALTDSISRETELAGAIKVAHSGQKIFLTKDITLTVLSPLVKPGKKIATNIQNTETSLSAFAGFIPITNKESNDWSIVLLLQYNHFSALLAADAEMPLELALLEAGLLGDVDVLKVGHHGSKFSTSEEFLDKITPETSLVSVGENNPYGHPTALVLDRLRKKGVKILRSDQLGTVSIDSDGEQYWLVP